MTALRSMALALACGVTLVACDRAASDESDAGAAPPTEAPILARTRAAMTAQARAARTVARPSNVPADYVATPNGFFHPSCVVSMGDDEVLGRDLLVRGLDGRVRRSIAACAHPSYSALGRPLALDAAATPSAAPSKVSPADAFYDGWLISYWYEGTLPPDATLTGKWIVPASPSGDAVTGSNPVTIYYFDDFEMETTSTIEILQPVLGYGYPNGSTWGISSWNCCASGIQTMSALVAVNPGDLIEGVTSGTDCDATSVCQAWTVTTTDVTTGQSTVLHTTEATAANIANSAVLETYGVTACDMLPPGGEETFFDTTISAVDAGTLAVSYFASTSPNTGSPACGYAATTSGDDYTLVYSTAPTSLATTTTLEADPQSGVFGTSVTMTATVTSGVTSPAMAGNVTFHDGAASLGVVDVVASVDGSGHQVGTASLHTASLAVGVHTLTATFGGENAYAVSTSASATETVSAIATVTVLVADPTSVTEGASVGLTATITGAASPTNPALAGRVIFYDGPKSLGAITIVPATGTGGAQGAAVATAFLDAGTMAGTDGFKAAYAGDAEHDASTSSVASVTVASTLAVTPSTGTTAPEDTVQFAVSGGVSPVSWSLSTNGSSGTVSATGLYRAGAIPNSNDVVLATDAAGATATATIAVGAAIVLTPDAAPPPEPDDDAGIATPIADASPPVPIGDASPIALDASSDAGASHGGGGGGGSGCGCAVAGRSSTTPDRSSAIAVAMLAFAFTSRRRRGRLP